MGRKNLKIDDDTHQRLTSLKREGETWNAFLTRIADDFEDDPSWDTAQLGEQDVDRIREAVRSELRDQLSELTRR